MKVVGISVEFICVQCALRYLVGELEAGREPGPPPVLSGSMAEHVKAEHADGDATQRERHELMERLKKVQPPALRNAVEAHMRARNAVNN